MQNDILAHDPRDFFSIPNFEAQIQEGVMPLLTKKGDGYVQVGSGFIINKNGLMMTATHVIKEVENHKTREINDNGEWYDHMEMYAVFIANERDGLNPNERLGELIRVQKVWYCDEHDIGLCFLQPIAFNGERIYFPQFTLSPGLPKLNEKIIGFGYPYNKVEMESNFVKYFHKNAFTKGEITEIYPIKHDLGKFRFPCFKTEARFDHGMSGGPIFNEEGNVCGVICSGLSPTEDTNVYTSYGSLIGQSLTIELDLAFDEGKETEDLTLFDLVERGYVATDETINQVNIEIKESKEGQPVKDIDFDWFK